MTDLSKLSNDLAWWRSVILPHKPATFAIVVDKDKGGLGLQSTTALTAGTPIFDEQALWSTALAEEERRVINGCFTVEQRASHGIARKLPKGTNRLNASSKLSLATELQKQDIALLAPRDSSDLVRKLEVNHHIVENGSDGDLLFIGRMVSLFNHSCSPSVELHYQAEQRSYRAVVVHPVAATKPLEISYIACSLPFHQRKAMLEHHWGILCTCSTCQDDSAHYAQPHLAAFSNKDKFIKHPSAHDYQRNIILQWERQPGSQTAEAAYTAALSEGLIYDAYEIASWGRVHGHQDAQVTIGWSQRCVEVSRKLFGPSSQPHNALLKQLQEAKVTAWLQ